MRVELRAEARDDLEDGALFYAKQADGLERYFLDSLQTDLKSLEISGVVHEVYYGFHRQLATKFPYAIYYLISAEVIDVVAVLDCRRDPDAIALTLKRRK